MRFSGSLTSVTVDMVGYDEIESDWERDQVDIDGGDADYMQAMSARSMELREQDFLSDFANLEKNLMELLSPPDVDSSTDSYSDALLFT